MAEDNNSLKDELVSHWDLDYMTDAQRAEYLAERDRKRFADAARGGAGNNRLEAHAYAKAAPDDNKSTMDWRWTGLAAAVVALLTGLAWLFTIGPLG